MLVTGLAQLHTAQRTGRQSLAFSPVAVPACFAFSLPQAMDFEQEPGKRSWQAETGHNDSRWSGNYSGCEIEINPSSESLTSGRPQFKG